MKKKQLTALLVVFLFINIASVSLILTTTASTPAEPLDTEPLLFDSTPDRFAYDINFEGLSTSSLKAASDVGDIKTFLKIETCKMCIQRTIRRNGDSNSDHIFRKRRIRTPRQMESKELIRTIVLI